MQIGRYIAQLEVGIAVIEALGRGVAPEQARWKPQASEWSILEVINHLYDEERDDFRFRLDQTLHHSEEPLPPIDPEAWATQRRYNERSIDESLLRLLSERRSSITWLRKLNQTDWDQPVNHPSLSGLRAGDLLASWAAHDMLHIRQLNELHWQYLRVHALPYSPVYAGEW